MLDYTNMLPRLNIIGGKMSLVSSYGGGGSGGVLTPLQGFRGRSTLRKFLGSKEYVDWLKIELNTAEIITVQDYTINKKS